ncbi:MAG: hypothetical protein JZU65_16635 [Chlorobium sp.]|nr:hypothetical protein [Chlorobium sp.]
MLSQLVDIDIISVVMLLFFYLINRLIEPTNIIIAFFNLSLASNIAAVFMVSVSLLYVLVIHFVLISLVVHLIRVKSKNLRFSFPKIRTPLKSKSSRAWYLALFLICFICLSMYANFDFAANKENKITAGRELGQFYSFSAFYVSIFISAILALPTQKKYEAFIWFAVSIYLGLILGSGSFIFLAIGYLCIQLTGITAAQFTYAFTFLLYIGAIYFKQPILMAGYFRVIESGVGLFLVIQDKLKLPDTSSVGFLSFLRSRFFGSFGETNDWAAMFGNYGRWGEFGGPNEGLYSLAIASPNILSLAYVTAICLYYIYVVSVRLNSKNFGTALLVVASYPLLQSSIGSLYVLIKVAVLVICSWFMYNIILISSQQILKGIADCKRRKEASMSLESNVIIKL